MSQTGDHGAYTFTWMSSKATYAQRFKCLIWVSISAGSVNKIVPYFCVGTSFSSSFSTCWDSVQDLADSLMLLPCFQPIVSIEFCAYSYSSWSRSRLQLSLFKAFFLLFKEKKERKSYPSQALCCTSTICDVQSIPGVMFQWNYVVMYIFKRSYLVFWLLSSLDCCIELQLFLHFQECLWEKFFFCQKCGVIALKVFYIKEAFSCITQFFLVLGGKNMFTQFSFSESRLKCM